MLRKAVLVAGVLALNACGPVVENPPPTKPASVPPKAGEGVSFRRLEGESPRHASVYIMKVEETGCEYVFVEMFQSGVALTPNMTRLGTDARTYQTGCISPPRF